MSPSNLEPQWAAAELLVERQKYKPAEIQLIQLSKLQSERMRAFRMLAEVARLQGDHVKVRLWLRNLYAVMPEEEFAILLLSPLYLPYVDVLDTLR